MAVMIRARLLITIEVPKKHGISSCSPSLSPELLLLESHTPLPGASESPAALPTGERISHSVGASAAN